LLRLQTHVSAVITLMFLL